MAVAVDAGDRRRAPPGNLLKTTSGRQYSTTLSVILVTPLILLLFFGFFYPVGRMLIGSLFDPEFTLDNYVRIFTEPLYLRVLWRTFEVAFYVTISALIVGYPVAYAMARMRTRWAIVVAACVLIPLWTSVLVRSYAWIILLQRNGVVNDLLISIGVTSEPLRMIYTEGAVYLAMTHVLLPFMILPLYTVLRTIPDDLPRAALNLGAGRLTVLVRIIIPLSLPGVFAGTLLTFILALGFYITPALLGGPEVLMMATLIGQQATMLLDWPFAGALATVLLILTLLLAFAFRRFMAFSKGFQGGH